MRSNYTALQNEIGCTSLLRMMNPWRLTPQVLGCCVTEETDVLGFFFSGSRIELIATLIAGSRHWCFESKTHV